MPKSQLNVETLLKREDKLNHQQETSVRSCNEVKSKILEVQHFVKTQTKKLIDFSTHTNLFPRSSAQHQANS